MRLLVKKIRSLVTKNRKHEQRLALTVNAKLKRRRAQSPLRSDSAPKIEADAEESLKTTDDREDVHYEVAVALGMMRTLMR
jgi:hypothetical protein